MAIHGFAISPSPPNARPAPIRMAPTQTRTGRRLGDGMWTPGGGAVSGTGRAVRDAMTNTATTTTAMAVPRMIRPIAESDMRTLP
jgi:hypothetical protein